MTTGYEVPAWQTEMKQLAPSVYAYIQAKGTWFVNNAGLIVGNEYAIVVDTLTSVGLTQKLIEEIRKVTDKPVRYLVNTHPHGDHIWGNHLFTGADVVCHVRCREEVLKSEIPDPDMLTAAYPEFDFHGIAITHPHITFDRQLNFYLNNTEVQLLYYKPAHTVADIIAYLPQEGIIFAGDLLFLCSTPLCMMGSFAGWLDVLDAMSELDANTYVPGHGPVCGPEGLRECREYLVLIMEEGRKRLTKGMSVDEAARDIDLGRFKGWANWERIAANLERLQRELRGEEPNSEIDVTGLLASMRALAAGEEPRPPAT